MFGGKVLFWEEIKDNVEAAKLEQYGAPDPGNNKSCILRTSGTWTESSIELRIQAEFFLLSHHFQGTL